MLPLEPDVMVPLVPMFCPVLTEEPLLVERPVDTLDDWDADCPVPTDSDWL